MAIIKKFSPFQNLSSFQVFINDTQPNSQYFKITEFAETLTGGKNGFLIEGPEFLRETTEVKVELLDVENTPIYYEPGNGIPEYYEGTTKLVSGHVYDDTPIGTGKITILGELKNYIDANGTVVPVPDEWKNIYNIKWERTFQINKNLSNETRVRFYKRPSVSITELVKPIFSKTIPTVTDTGTATGEAILPSSGTPIASYRAGTSYRLTRSDGSWDKDVDENQITFSGLGYSSRIIEVLNDKQVLVNIPYTTGSLVDNFVSQSYSVTYSDFQNEIIGESTLTGSFAKIDITQLKTFVGDVARVKVFRKSRNAVGDFQFVQESKLESSELLRDITTTANTEIPYGRFDEYNLETYWITSSDDHGVSIDSSVLSQAVKFDYDTLAGGVQKLITSQSFSISKDVEYTLDFRTLLSGSFDDTNKSIKAYFSSSNFTQDFININASAIYRTRQSISQNILSENTGDAHLVFEVTGDDWYLSNVSLKNAQDTSFSPDEFTLIQDIPRKLVSETFDFRFEFYDINNNYIPVDVAAVGVFDGGNDFPTSGKLLTFESDRNAFRFSSGSIANPAFQQIQFKVTQNNLTGSITFASQAYDVDGNYIDPLSYNGIYPGTLTSVTPAGAILRISDFSGSDESIMVGSIIYTASLENLEEFETVYRLEDGDNAPQLIVTSNANQFIYEPTALEPKPSGQGITIRAQRKNLASLITPLTINKSDSNGPDLTYVDTVGGIDTYTLSATAFSQSFSANSFDEITYQFTGSDVFGNEQYDEITISKVINFDGVSITLSNESTTFRANGQGLVLDTFDSGDGNVEVRIGNKIIEHDNGLTVPNRFDITGSIPTNVTEKDASYTSDEYGITVLAQDSGSVILNIKYLAGDGVTTQSFNKKVNYTKNRIAQPSITFDTSNKTQNVDAKSTGVQLTDFDDSVLTIREFYTGSVTTFASGDIDLVITSGSDDSTGNPLVTRSGLTLSFGDLPDGVNSTQIGLTATLTDSEGFGREVSDTISLSKTLASAPNIEFQVTPSAQTLTSNSVGGSPGSATNLVVTANEGGSSRTLSALSADAPGTGITITSETPATGVIVLNTSAMSVDTGTITISASTTNTEGTTITKTLTATVSKAKTAQPSITFSATPQAQTIDAKSDGDLIGLITDVVISGFEGNTALTYNQDSLLSGQYKITGVTQTNITVASTTPSTSTIDITALSADSTTETATIEYKDSEGTSGVSTIKFSLSKAKKASPVVVAILSSEAQTITKTAGGTYGNPDSFTVSVNEGGSNYTYDGTSPYSNSSFRISTISGGTNSSGTITPTTPTTDAGTTVSMTISYVNSEGTAGTITKTHKVGVTTDGSVGADGVTIVPSKTSQNIVRDFEDLTFTTIQAVSHAVKQGSTTFTAVSSATALANSQYRIKPASLTNCTESADGEITPTQPTDLVFTTGGTASYTIQYKDGEGNENEVEFTHEVTVTTNGTTGPGVVFSGEWASGVQYQFSTGVTGRRDAVIYSGTYYAVTAAHTSTSSGTTGPPGVGTNWESLGTGTRFSAAEISISKQSFIKETLTIGTNDIGSAYSANITLFGGNAYPYIAVGQATVGYGNNGIWIGNDGGTSKLSLVNGTSSFLKWNGSSLEIKGSITVTGGDAATQTQAQGYANTAQSNAITAAETYTDGIVESVSIATMNLTLSSNMEITNGRELRKTGGTAWAEQVYSGIGFKDGAFISFKNSTANVNANYMVGLNSDPTANASYTSLDYAWYVRQGNTYEVRVNGSVVTPDVTLPSVADGDVLAIFYDGSSVKWYRNNTLYNTVSAANGLNLYLDSSFNTNTTTPCISWFEFGPAGQTNSSSKTDGEVGGWIIDSSAIYSGNKVSNGNYTTAGGITIGSSGYISANKFRIDVNGNAYFKGDVTGANGNFEGKITAGSMVLGNDAGGAGVDGIYIDANDYWYANGNFSFGNGGVTWNGTTLTISGNIVGSDISGGSISGTSLTGGSLNIPSAISAKFSVDSDGNMTAQDASIEGTVNIQQGSIGGWVVDSIEEGGVFRNEYNPSAPGTGSLVFDPVKPEIQGFKIDGNTVDKKISIHPENTWVSSAGGSVYVFDMRNNNISNPWSIPANKTSNSANSDIVYNTTNQTESTTDIVVPQQGTYELTGLYKISGLTLNTPSSISAYSNYPSVSPQNTYDYWGTNFSPRRNYFKVDLVFRNTSTNAETVVNVQTEYAIGAVNYSYYQAVNYGSGLQWSQFSTTSNAISTTTSFTQVVKNVTLPAGTYRAKYRIGVGASSGMVQQKTGLFTYGTPTYYTTTSSPSNIGYNSLSFYFIQPVNLVEMSSRGIQIINDANSYLQLTRTDSTPGYTPQMIAMKGGTMQIYHLDYADSYAGDTLLQVDGKISAASLQVSYPFSSPNTSGVGLNQNLVPRYDNSVDLGNSNFRYDDIYATNTTIQSSDKKEKTNISGSILGLNFINNLNPVSYTWISGSSGRTHYGLIAQEVSESLAACSVHTDDFGGFIQNDIYVSGSGTGSIEVAKGDIYEHEEELGTIDNWQYSHSKYGLRYSEFISPMIKAIQELSEKVSQLESQISGSL